jgi:hypothetical protein
VLLNIQRCSDIASLKTQKSFQLRLNVDQPSAQLGLLSFTAGIRRIQELSERKRHGGFKRNVGQKSIVMKISTPVDPQELKQW